MTRITMHRQRDPGRGIFRRYYADGKLCTQLPARAKGAFITRAKSVQGQRLHRPTAAESLWVDGRYVGMAARTVCGKWITNFALLDADSDKLDHCDACLLEGWPGVCVYRLYDDRGGLLYIGCTVNLLNRLLSHLNAAGVTTWSWMIASYTFEVFSDHDAALRAEKVAIVNECPRFNKDLTDRATKPGRRRSAFLHLVHSEEEVAA